MSCHMGKLKLRREAESPQPPPHERSISFLSLSKLRNRSPVSFSLSSSSFGNEQDKQNAIRANQAVCSAALLPLPTRLAVHSGQYYQPPHLPRSSIMYASSISPRIYLYKCARGKYIVRPDESFRRRWWWC